MLMLTSHQADAQHGTSSAATRPLCCPGCVQVGYCRSMNVIVGMLLVAMNRNEENAFWLLSSLVEDILYPGTYSRNLSGCQVG